MRILYSILSISFGIGALLHAHTNRKPLEWQALATELSISIVFAILAVAWRDK